MNNYTYVRVIFPSDDGPDDEKKQYLFKSYLHALSVGDYVICDTRYGFSVGIISATNVPEEDVRKFNAHLKGLKEIAGYATMDDFFRRKYDRHRAMEIKAQMDERMKHLQENAVYELMAKADPELKKLFDEYKTLQEVQ